MDVFCLITLLHLKVLIFTEDFFSYDEKDKLLAGELLKNVASL